jgi:hypothetical protein
MPFDDDELAKPGGADHDEIADGRAEAGDAGGVDRR